MPYTREQRKEQARLRREAGLCINCGAKAVKSFRCQRHLNDHNARRRKGAT